MVTAGLLAWPGPVWLRALLPLLFLLPPVAKATTTEAGRTLCCAAGGFEPTRRLAVEFSRREQVPRPLLANPDLGAVSFGKELNILDLGDLGSTVMAQVKQPQDRANLLLRIFRPDVVEIHGGWVNEYAASVNNRRFKEGYDAAEGLWVRQGDTASRQLARAQAHRQASREAVARGVSRRHCILQPGCC